MKFSCNTPDRCNWIPIHEDGPTEQTSELIEFFDVNATVDRVEEILARGPELLDATRRRAVFGMACTKCGTIRKADECETLRKVDDAEH